MKMNTVSTIILSVLCFWTSALSAQHTVTTSGGNASGASGSSSYTVGQILYNTNTGSGGAESQGVQQAYEIYTYGLDEHPGITLNYTVYPNPTADYLVLKRDVGNESALQWYLYNSESKILAKGKCSGFETMIDMKSCSPAVYLLVVSENDKVLKSFRIIKK